MSTLGLSVTSAMIWFTIFIIAHIGLTQVCRGRRLSHIVICSFIGSATACVATVVMSLGDTSVTPQQWLLAGGIAVFLMSCAFILYMPFVFVVTSSLSVETLLLLERADGRMSCADLARVFVSQDAARHRLETMRKNGFVLIDNNRYRLTRKGRWTAEFFASIKRLWGLWPGG